MIGVLALFLAVIAATLQVEFEEPQKSASHVINRNVASKANLASLPGKANPPALSAKSAIVIEASTGKVLYEKNASDLRYPASTTKIMTLITALDLGNLDEVVTVSSNAANTEGSSIYLEAGERLKLLDVLYGLMLHSGNDATVAVAEHMSGSVEKFARLMTAKARALGADRTNFTNPSGLPDPQHVSTARDLAVITAYGYKNPLFRKIVGTRNIVIPWHKKEHDRDLYNENKLLWRYEGANGVKTGYTDAAGLCLVSGAARKNIQLIAVVLDADQMWQDSAALLDFGFSQLRSVELFKQGEVLTTSRVIGGNTDRVKLVPVSNLAVPVSAGDLDQIQLVADGPDRVQAPIAEGQKIGVVRVLYKTNEIGNIDLVAAETIERASWLKRLGL